MSTFKLDKSHWQGEGYYYLSKEDSDLYDKHKNKADINSQLIVKLLLDKAASCYASHCRSRY